MGWGNARRLVWGGLAALALLVPAGISSAATDGQRGRTVLGGASADGGTSGLPAGWTFEHPRPGLYRLVGTSGGLVSLDVVRWEAVADVTIAPVSTLVA
jgi:hypothetical protein